MSAAKLPKGWRWVRVGEVLKHGDEIASQLTGRIFFGHRGAEDGGVVTRTNFYARKITRKSRNKWRVLADNERIRKSDVFTYCFSKAMLRGERGGGATVGDLESGHTRVGRTRASVIREYPVARTFGRKYQILRRIA